MQMLKRLGLFLLSLAVIAAAVISVQHIILPDVPAVAMDVQRSFSALSASLEDLPADLKTQQAQLDALPVIVKNAGSDTLYYGVNTAQGVGPVLCTRSCSALWTEPLTHWLTLPKPARSRRSALQR